MKNKFCPCCGKLTLTFIERCSSDPDVIKTSWTCDCVPMVVYLYEFIQDKK